jgi:hypothetical protein
VGDALGHAPRVDEDQGRPVRADEGREAVVDLAPLLVRGDGLEIRPGELDGQIEIAPVPDVDDGARTVGAGEEPRSLADGVDGGGEADALRAGVGEGDEPRESRMRAWSSSTTTVRT